MVAAFASSSSSSSSSSPSGNCSLKKLEISQGSLTFFLLLLVSSPGAAAPPATSAPPRTSSPPAASAASPPLSSESLAVLRTSFHERKVLRRDVFALSWRIRKKRSEVVMERWPRRVAKAVDRLSFLDISFAFFCQTR